MGEPTIGPGSAKRVVTEAALLSEEILARVTGAADFTGVDGPALVACSGGADSVALLLVAARRDPTVVVVHVDHGLHPRSAEHARRVVELAEALGVRCRVMRVHVGAGPNLEARARDARYGALEAARREQGDGAILVAHTADDQAETVLLALLRGSGSAGLAGMAHRRGPIVRPFLGVRRAETRALVRAWRIEPVDDPMNGDLRYRRVRVRQEVLPLLSRVAERDLVPVLARQASVLHDESVHLDGLADALLTEAGTPTPRARVIADAPLAVGRRAVRRWLGVPPPSAAEVERVLAVARGEARAAQLAGGRRVERHAGALHRWGPSEAAPVA